MLPLTLDVVRAYEEAGVDRLNSAPWGRDPWPPAPERIHESLERLRDEVLSKL